MISFLVNLNQNLRISQFLKTSHDNNYYPKNNSYHRFKNFGIDHLVTRKNNIKYVI